MHIDCYIQLPVKDRNIPDLYLDQKLNPGLINSTLRKPQTIGIITHESSEKRLFSFQI